jgi:hypothetical protein
VRDFIIKPVFRGYKVLRADELPEPGIITRQILDYLQSADVVVADLSLNTPNVWYELAIRHAVAKPFIQIVQEGQLIPFDTAHQRTIPYDLVDHYSVKLCKEEVRKQLKAIEKPDFKVETPIGQALALQALAKEGDAGTMIADLISLVTPMANDFKRRQLEAVFGPLRTPSKPSTAEGDPRNPLLVLGQNQMFETGAERLPYPAFSKPGRRAMPVKPNGPNR